MLCLFKSFGASSIWQGLHDGTNACITNEQQSCIKKASSLYKVHKHIVIGKKVSRDWKDHWPSVSFNVKVAKRAIAIVYTVKRSKPYVQ